MSSKVKHFYSIMCQQKLAAAVCHQKFISSCCVIAVQILLYHLHETTQLPEYCILRLLTILAMRSILLILLWQQNWTNEVDGWWRLERIIRIFETHYNDCGTCCQPLFVFSLALTIFIVTFILQGITSRLKETAVMLFLLGVLVNCVAWLLSSMLGGTQINQQNVYG